MNDYISRQDVWKLIFELQKFYEEERETAEDCEEESMYVGSINALTAMEDGLSDIPATDVRPVAYGEWASLGGDEWCCTNCGHVISTEGSWERPCKKYCPNCGCYMGEKVND